MNQSGPIHHGADDEQAFRIAYLMAGYIKGTLTKSEHQELDDWVSASMANQRLFEELTDEANLQQGMEWMASLQTEKTYSALKQQGAFARRPQKNKRPQLWLAAASVVVLVVVLFWVQGKQGQTKTPGMDEANLVNQVLQPGGNRATLTLADGKTIDLAQAKKGNIREGAETLWSKTADGEIEYAKNTSVKTAEMHSLTTPAGGQYQVALADGTKVWLNASSSLRYPTFFTGATREVELQGEAYFEVSKDSSRPFLVRAGNATVRVLGTSFNVNAYTLNRKVSVALAEGSVQLNGAAPIKPGQQASVDALGHIQVLAADLPTIMAWKEGLFVFKNATIQQVMEEAARWYDAKLVYVHNNTEHFNATLPRSMPIDKLLQMLEGTGRVHFRIQGRTVTVIE
ncbi:MAG: FecR domain-containing protein [Bacteroidetes bacterium]|nr:FecR domain-containing protein [Bacteroidota bacterium]